MLALGILQDFSQECSARKTLNFLVFKMERRGLIEGEMIGCRHANLRKLGLLIGLEPLQQAGLR